MPEGDLYLDIRQLVHDRSVRRHQHSTHSAKPTISPPLPAALVDRGVKRRLRDQAAPADISARITPVAQGA
jgi:hypothetical protein